MNRELALTVERIAYIATAPVCRRRGVARAVIAAIGESGGGPEGPSACC